ncbi:MAG: L,D-transpeptidase [Xanthobacteraceae bacterium]
MRIRSLVLKSAVHLIAGTLFSVGTAMAGPLALYPTNSPANSNVLASPGMHSAAPAEEVDITAPVEPALQRQVVNYAMKVAPGSIVIDTQHTYLYYVLGDGKAIRYGIGVGREGFTWSGTQTVSRKSEWPDWYPPQEMIARQSYLPRFMAGGPGNPLGARAIYLGNTMYRIHGTNAPQTIGHKVSSGCIRLLNDDVADLYNRVDVGTKVIVLPNQGGAAVATSAVPSRKTVTQSASNLH